MAQPNLLLYVTDQKLERAILDNPAIRKFNIIRVAEAESWIERLPRETIDIAIAQVDRFTKSELQALTDCNLLSKVEAIFMSNGEPNPHIDKAMMRGVSYHLRTPIDIEFLEELANELHTEFTETEVEAEKVIKSELDQFGLLVGSSKAMRRLYRVIRKSADSDASIFILGESGSGKELVANTVHMMSGRCDKPFVAINCGAISTELIESELFGHVKGAFTGAGSDRVGVFEQADGGTLFLDEVTEMPLSHQVKLLRVLETGEYRKVGSDKTRVCDVRIISATNREPTDAVQDELFREDIYFRLAQIPIRVPPLREREGDIVGLAKHFLAHRNAKEESLVGFSSDALEKVGKHSWPGNVRELKHAIERAFILADDAITTENLIVDEQLQSSQIDQIPTGMPLDEIEKAVIIKTLDENEGNKTEAANILGISVKTLYNKLEKYEKE